MKRMSEPEWDDLLPDWRDNLKMVEVEWDDGRRMTGQLDYEDTTSGPDEWPLYFIVTDDGQKISIADIKRWRPLINPS